MSVLETKRLVLRKMSMGDTENLLTIFSDPEAMRFYPGTKDVSETHGWIQWNLNSYEQYGHGLWIAEFKDTGEFAGQCGLVVQKIDDIPEVEIGYLFRRQCWGQGLATEAAQACRDYGFGPLGLSRLISLINPGNLASRRVAEKVGMTLERQIVKWDRDVCLYAMERLNTPTSGADAIAFWKQKGVLGIFADRSEGSEELATKLCQEAETRNWSEA